MIEMMIRDDSTSREAIPTPSWMRRHVWTGVAVLLVSMVVTFPSSARPQSRARGGAPAGAEGPGYGARPAERPSSPGDAQRRLTPRSHTIERGETVVGVLSGFDLGSEQVARLVDSVTERWDVRRALVGSQVELTVDSTTGTVEGLTVETDDERKVEVSRAADGFVSRVVPSDAKPVETALPASRTAAAPSEPATASAPAEPVAPAPVVPANPTRTATFGSGDTLATVLAKLGVEASDRTRIAARVAKSWNVRRADIGTRVELTLDATTQDPLSLSITPKRPGTSPVTVALGEVASAPAALAVAAPVVAQQPATTVARTATLAKNASISSLFTQLGVAKADVGKVVEAASGQWNTRRAQVGTVVQLSFDPATGQASSLTVRPPKTDDAIEVALPSGIALAGAANVTPVASPAPPPAPAAVAAAKPADVPARVATHEAVLKRGETLGEVLVDLGVAASDVPSVATTVAKKWNVRTAKPGTRIRLVVDEGTASAIEISARSGSKPLTVALGPGVTVAGGTASSPAAPSVAKAAPKSEPERPAPAASSAPDVRVVSGQVQGRFHDAAVQAGLDPATISELASIFAGEVDLNGDVDRGDRFRVLLEMPRADSRRARPRILAAEVTTGKEAHRVFMVTSGDGRPEYYNDQARTARRPFLRSPLDVTKVTSPFSMGRYHPILGYERPHLGVDLAAPKGTPIRAVGDGVVEYAGWRAGGDGRYLKIRHDGAYATSFSHLSGFAPGIREGKKVKRGQVIGYTGSTGLSTGPHLHFAFLKNDQYVDPMRVSVSGGRVLTGKERREFDGIRAARLAALNGAGGNGNSQVALAGR